MKKLLNIESFSLKDWNNAIHFMTTINQSKQAVDLAMSVLKKYPKSSFTYYLLGKAFNEQGDKKKTIHNLRQALLFDKDNVEAKRLLDFLEK